MTGKLIAPKNLTIDFKPSAKQYELWKLLQPNYCPRCGGNIEQNFIGYDAEGHAEYEPKCAKCGNIELPQLILGGGAAGGGKGAMLDSQILTPYGFRKLRDIKVGDTITSPNTGGMQKVVYLHPIDMFDFYRVKFRDGTYFDCTEGHLWQLHQSRKHKSKKAEKYGLPTDEVWPAIKMYEWYRKKEQGMYKGQHLIIPLTEPVKFTFGDKGNYYIDPYILGAIIGDGCITNSVLNDGYVQFTTMDQEIVNRFIACGYDMSHKAKRSDRAFAYNIKDNTLIECLKKHNIAGNRSQTHFIPKVYKFGTVEDRIKLMQGLMDTDGYVDDRGHMSYTTTSKQLAEDVAFVVRSLGGVATITSDTGSYKDAYGEKHACGEVWTVFFRTKMDPDLCGLTRKKNRAKYDFNGGNSEYGKRIIDVEYIGKREGRCISVSEPNGLYVVDDFTVTHNSYLGSCWIVSSCFRFPGIRAVIARKVIKSVKESTFNTVKNVMSSWGLVKDVHYKINNVENTVTFWNESTIFLKELEDAPSDPQFERLGSNEYTIAFVDEVSEISEKAIEVLFSRLRWKVAETFKTPRLLMTTNPCLTWVRSRFVQDEDGNPVVTDINEAYVPFTLFDNPDEQFRITYRMGLSRIKDKATRERLLYGNWDFIDSGEMCAYDSFDGEKHLIMNLFEKKYDSLKPVITSWDFNVSPYMSMFSAQINYEKKEVYILEECLGMPAQKENNTPKLSQKVANIWLRRGHVGGIVITGDPAGKSRSSQTEDGVNNYTIITNNMSSPVLKPKTLLLNTQPPHTTRLEFVNALLEGYDGWTIMIDIKCRKLTEDLVYQKKNSDGTKQKIKATDPKSKVKYEKYGHLSDCLDYFLCLFLKDSYAKYVRASSQPVVSVQSDTVYGDFNF